MSKIHFNNTFSSGCVQFMAADWLATAAHKMIYLLTSYTVHWFLWHFNISYQYTHFLRHLSINVLLWVQSPIFFFIKENKHYKYKSVCILTIDDNICDHVVTLEAAMYRVIINHIVLSNV